MSFKLDPRKILSHPIIYTTYQKIVGGYRARKLFVENNVNAKEGQKILAESGLPIIRAATLKEAADRSV